MRFVCSVETWQVLCSLLLLVPTPLVGLAVGETEPARELLDLWPVPIWVPLELALQICLLLPADPCFWDA